MFPLPVKRFDKTPMELKNEALWENIPKELKRIIITSSNRGMLIKHFCFCPSRFIEGRIMSVADKKVSINNYLNDYQENGISGTIALLTGENQNLKEKTYVKKK